VTGGGSTAEASVPAAARLELDALLLSRASRVVAGALLAWCVLLALFAPEIPRLTAFVGLLVLGASA
jgi:hypothetical protein